MHRIRLFSLLLVTLGSSIGCAARGTAPPRIERSERGSSWIAPRGNAIRIVTINMWGVVALGLDWADHIDERFEALAHRLGRNESDLDIVLIQEAWKRSARRALLDDAEVGSRFPYRVDVAERPGGAGLVLLSAYPIEEARFLRFSNQGNCWKFWEGDCIGGKGVLAAKIIMAEQPVWIANTHLIACYTDAEAPETACDQQDANGETRAAQIGELRTFLDALSIDAPVVLGGDFNFTRTSRYYRMMSNRNRRDAADGSESAAWKETGQRDPAATRIDYVWIRAGATRHFHAPTPIEEIMTKRVDLGSDDSVPLSDHPALAIVLCLVKHEDPTDPCPRECHRDPGPSREASGSSRSTLRDTP